MREPPWSSEGFGLEEEEGAKEVGHGEGESYNQRVSQKTRATSKPAASKEPLRKGKANLEEGRHANKKGAGYFSATAPSPHPPAAKTPPPTAAATHACLSEASLRTTTGIRWN
ncbi:unnamed protein product [Prorocentrum cordatum]|uniref:Uncharacterized protein n=1 Tax=Prorocentrum cordatum TaxID=2364126 RepID=A0ABN9TUY5_9DINO|nr:unnamed protein product [Polarella glacialis]